MFLCSQETECGRRASFVWCNLLCNKPILTFGAGLFPHAHWGCLLVSEKPLHPPAMATRHQRPCQHLCATMLLFLSLSSFSSASNWSMYPVVRRAPLFCLSLCLALNALGQTSCCWISIHTPPCSMIFFGAVIVQCATLPPIARPPQAMPLQRFLLSFLLFPLIGF